jgi:hypothetical protein
MGLQLAGTVAGARMPFARAGEIGSAGGKITAYHASPHDFDKFDLSKIGTGEGAQAYGHGLYFAENEGTAEFYKQKLLGLRDNTAMATSLADKDKDLYRRVADAAAQNYTKVTNNEIGDLLAHIAGGGELPGVGDDLTKKIKQFVSPGRMYQVSINADPEHFLDWDKPLKDQSDRTKTALAKVFGVSPKEFDTSLSHPQDLMATLGDQEHTQKLREAGIPGIKYLDQGSRTGGEGTRNYVVFDDKLIDIMKKYGIAGLGALPAAGAYHFKTHQVEHDPFAQ